jgi:hypothetical protein
MAIPYVGLLSARSRARFHVQVELSSLVGDFQTPAAIPGRRIGCADLSRRFEPFHR